MAEPGGWPRTSPHPHAGGTHSNASSFWDPGAESRVEALSRAEGVDDEGHGRRRSSTVPPPEPLRPNAPFHRQRLVRPLSKSRTPPRTPSPDPPHPPHFHLPPRSSTPSHLPSLLHPPNLPHRHPLGPPRLLPSRRPPPPRSSNPPKHLYRRLLPLHSPSSLTSSSG